MERLIQVGLIKQRRLKWGAGSLEPPSQPHSVTDMLLVPGPDLERRQASSGTGKGKSTAPRAPKKEPGWGDAA